MIPARAWAAALVLILGPVCVVVAEVSPILDLRNLTSDAGVVFFGEHFRTVPFYRVVAGDLNGDGIRDLVISAPLTYSASFVATVYVVFGGSDALASGFVDLATLGAPDGFIMRSPGGTSSFSMSTHSGVDINLDGIEDLIIASPCHSPDAATCKGQVFVIYGHPTIGADGSFDVRSLDGTNGFVINGRAQNDALGDNEGPIPTPDYNSDGYPDIVLNATAADVPGRVDAGQTYVIFGGPIIGASGSFEIASLNHNTGITINGLFAGSGVGRLGDVGDFNADGTGDITLGGLSGPPDRPNAGTTRVLFGGTPPDENGFLEWGDLPNEGGFVIYGAGAHFGEYGQEPVGDVNGDGYVDHMIYKSVGLGRVVFGGPHLSEVEIIDLGELDGTNGFSAGPCCRVFQAAGDLDDDGYAEIVRQDSFAGTDGRFSNGRVNVAFGFEGIGSNGTFTVPLAPDGVNGFEIRGASDNDLITPIGWVPDINGDGLPELVLQATLRRSDGTVVGGGYMVYGRRRYDLGDFDQDFDVDLHDFLSFSQCFNGPAHPPAGTCAPSTRADFDNDGDVDLADYATFAQHFTGAQ